MSAPEDTPRHEVAVLVRPGVRPMELGLVHQPSAAPGRTGSGPRATSRTDRAVRGQPPVRAPFPNASRISRSTAVCSCTAEISTASWSSPWRISW